MRLINHLALKVKHHPKRSVPSWEFTRSIIQKQDLELIIADEVFNFVQSEVDENHFTKRYDRMGLAMRPPFTHTFIEMAGNEDTIDAVKFEGITGFACECKPLEESTEYAMLLDSIDRPDIGEYMIDGGEAAREHLATLRESATHCISVSVSMMTTQKHGPEPYGTIFAMPIVSLVFLDRNGMHLGRFDAKDSAEIEQTERDVLSYNGLIQRLYCTLGMMNCRNISTVDATREYARPAKWHRRTKTAEVRYKVLRLFPFSKQSTTGVASGDHHADRAVHLCRGNFATYTAEAPLFGRIVGQIWKNAHLRGNAKAGVIIKDYEIGAQS